MTSVSSNSVESLVMMLMNAKPSLRLFRWVAVCGCTFLLLYAPTIWLACSHPTRQRLHNLLESSDLASRLFYFGE